MKRGENCPDYCLCASCTSNSAVCCMRDPHYDIPCPAKGCPDYTERAET